MRAVLCKAYGPPSSLVLEDVPAPQPAGQFRPEIDRRARADDRGGGRPRVADPSLRGEALPDPQSLDGAHAASASLERADLRGALLYTTNLTGANLAGADLTGARYDIWTRWPSGFDPAEHGAILMR